jgi:hypothetical protein
VDPPEGKRRIKGRDRKKAMSIRALADLDSWLNAARAAAE